MARVSAAGKVKSRVAEVIGRGWHRGMRSPVRLAAMMPARRATSRTSPLARPRSRISAAVAGAMRTSPLARASRRVSGLALVSTMRLAPCSSKCVRSLMRWSSVFDLFTEQRLDVFAYPGRLEELEVVDLADLAARIDQENARGVVE